MFCAFDTSFASLSPVTHPQQHWPTQPTRQVSTRGAKILTFSGVAVTILGVVALIFGGLAFVQVLPTDILTSAGEPGDQIITTAQAPGETTLTATAGESYTLWIVSPTSSTPELSRSDIEVRDADGKLVVLRSPSVNGFNTQRSYEAETMASFTAPSSGTLTISVAAVSLEDERVFISPAQQFGEFFGDVLGTIGLVFAGIGGLLVGGGMAVGGGIWWGSAVSKRKKQQQYGSGQQPQPYQS